MANLEEIIRTLPTTPGIYRYYDQSAQLLYIGKAANLRRRVSSYFQRPQDARISELVRRIDNIEYTQTDSVIEALILEANQIQLNQPPFNVRQKDDKSFITIVVTKEDYPRVLISRPTQRLQEPILFEFGPYPSTDAARRALTIIRKILPYRSRCSVPTAGQSNQRGCLDYQIGLCPGSCTGNLSIKEYSTYINKVILFLRGKKHILIKRILRDMENAAHNQQFERAAQLRNQHFALTHIRDVALLREEHIKQSLDENIRNPYPVRIEGYDISNILSDHAVGSMVVVSHGQIDRNEYRKFRIKTVIGQNDVAMMGEVLFRRFRHIDWPMPELLVIDGGKGHLRQTLSVLKAFRLTIPVIAVAKGPERKKLDLYPSPDQPYPIDAELMRLLRLARDEAHRFAISYHRQRRDSHFLS